jgi:hypothetical protein
MRSVAAWVITFALGCASGASVAPHTIPASPVSLTVVFQFDGPHSEKSFQEMKQELGAILKDSGILIDWRERNQVSSSDSFANLVVVKFRGACKIDPAADLDVESGPLAFTHTSDGAILPFSEVECDRVRSALLRASFPVQNRAHFEIVYGRAMARVLAHELYHVLAGTESHSHHGLTQRALSGAELASDELELDPDQLNLMRR